MLQFAEVPAYKRLGAGGVADNDQIADFMDVEDLVGEEELQEVEQFNPKSKTTNMSSLLRQIN